MCPKCKGAKHIETKKGWQRCTRCFYEAEYRFFRNWLGIIDTEIEAPKVSAELIGKNLRFKPGCITAFGVMAEYVKQQKRIQTVFSFEIKNESLEGGYFANFRWSDVLLVDLKRTIPNAFLPLFLMEMSYMRDKLGKITLWMYDKDWYNTKNAMVGLIKSPLKSWEEAGTKCNDFVEYLTQVREIE